MLQMFVRILYHDHGGIHHIADGNGDTGQTEDVGGDIELILQNKRNQHTQRQTNDGYQGAAHMQQEKNGDQGDNGDFFNKGLAQGSHRPVNETGTVVHRHDPHPWRERALNLGNFFFDLSNDGFGIFTEAHDHDAADDLALAVAFGDAAPQFRPQAHQGHIPD